MCMRDLLRHLMSNLFYRHHPTTNFFFTNYRMPCLTEWKARRLARVLPGHRHLPSRVPSTSGNKFLSIISKHQFSCVIALYFARPLGDSPSGYRSSRHVHLLVRLSRDVDRWSLIGSQGNGGVQQDDLLDRRVFGVPAAVGRQTKPSVLSCAEDICNNDNVVCYKGHNDEGVVDSGKVRRMDCLVCSGADGRRVCCRCCSSICWRFCLRRSS